MKKVLFFVFLSAALLNSLVFAKGVLISNSDKKALYDAKNCFISNDFGNAMKLCEAAKARRNENIKWELRCLNNSFKSYEVKRYGDSISLSMEKLKERQDEDSIAIINKYIELFGIEKFNDSKKSLLAFVESRNSYPEVEYLTGKIYQVEGEYDVAYSFFQKALAFADNLDVPEEKFDILYSISELSYLKGDMNQYEIDLLQIVSQDKHFLQDHLKKSIRNSISNVKSDCVEKFFKMFRNENYRVMDAYCSLAKLYDSMNEKQRCLDCIAMGTLTGFTKIIDVVTKRNPDFEYVDLNSLLVEASGHEDIVKWGKDNNLWESFYLLSVASHKAESPIFSVNLLKVLSNSLPDEYWRNSSKIKLSEITVH